MLRYLFIILFSFPTIVFAQDISGKVIYQLLLKKQHDSLNTQSNNYALSFAKNALLNNTGKKYELRFNMYESIFIELDKLGLSPGSFSISSSDKLYRNLKENIVIEQKDVFGKLFLVSDSLNNYNWKLTQESKLIGKLKSYKAEGVFKINNYGNSDSPEQLIKVIAWYSDSIPISTGPGEFYGLPGLIVELETKTYIYRVLETEIKETKDEIKKPKKGEVISKENYDKILNEKINEIRKKYKN
jgi:GLPGLI family protein